MAVLLTPGQTIDQRYVLRGQLGRGGMATVYEAFDPKLDLPVVLKVLPRQLMADPSFIARFRREGRMLARLTHPHIVRLYELGENESDGLYYLVLELLTGGTLKARQAPAPWTVEHVASVLRPVALAIDYAHHQSPPVVHRDLKPTNIIFGEHDRVVVSDFGLARMIAPDEAWPRASDLPTWGSITAGAVLGTPAYMAPEQAEGYPAGEPADRYSLGIMAYELLVGTVPFLADTPQATLIQVVTRPLPLPSQLNPAISPALERVLLKALAKDPSLRFATAQELVEALEDAARGPSITIAAPLPLTQPPPRARLSRRLLVTTGLALALMLAALGAVLSSYWAGQQSPEQTPAATPAPSAAAPPIALTAQQTATAPAATATPRPTAAPSTAPTPDAAQAWSTVLAELDTTWGHDWPRSIAVLDDFLVRAPNHAAARDKLYSALVDFGQQLIADGAPEEGIRQLERAVALQPARGEARDALAALTPAPAPAPTAVRQVIAPTSAPQLPTPTATVAKPAFVPPTRVPATPTKLPFSRPTGG